MKIKTQLFLGFATLSLCAGCLAQQKLATQITFKVIDDGGKLLSNIPIGIGTYIRTVPGEDFGKDVYDGPEGKTDKNGLVTLTGSSMTGRFYYGVGDVPGYYYDNGGEYIFKSRGLAQWEPWNPTVEITLKPIINPIGMYAVRPLDTHIKKANQKYGFDLMIGDWVTPIGKGVSADVFFETIGYWKSNIDFDSTLIITFPNLGDGIQKFNILPKGEGSIFRSPREALPDGYMAELRLRKARSPGQPSSQQVDETASDNNYFFRVRTQLDKKGEIKSTYYGKVYEGFSFGGAGDNSFLKIRSYYLSAEPNSRNMEFDPKHNLMKSIKKNSVKSP